MTDFPQYKTVSTDSLIPYARNSRTHSDAQVGKIAASIKEFGFLNPIIVDGSNGIIAGHGASDGTGPEVLRRHYQAVAGLHWTRGDTCGYWPDISEGK